MPGDFDPLTRELDLWQDSGRVAEFWWRDDDAVAPTPALERLLKLSDAFGIEIGVAMVPAPASDDIAGALAGHPGAVPLQHGFRHKNHAPPGAPAVECGGARPVAEVLRELEAGAARMRALFGTRFGEILAAPWNHIEPPVLAKLAASGFRGASAYGPRAAMQAEGLVVANVHVDPMNWRERRFAGTEKAISGILGELAARRTGMSDPQEPLGLLTHHLDHDEALWDFLPRFFETTAAHPAARWLTLRETFAGAQA
jgi:hypothetical protein